MGKPDYKAFGRDMMKLCEKHGVRMVAYDEGNVMLGPASAKKMGDYLFSSFEFSPSHALMADPYVNGKQIKLGAGGEGS